MPKHLIIFLCYIVVCCCKPQAVFAQLQTYKFTQIDSLQKIEPRPIFIFIYTTWCKYCMAMKQTTFKNKAIIATLNNKFYAVFLNAETKENIVFNNHLFKYKATGNHVGSHELAQQLSIINKQVVYPTTCILNVQKEIILQHSNYIEAVSLKYYLNKVLVNK